MYPVGKYVLFMTLYAVSYASLACVISVFWVLAFNRLRERWARVVCGGRRVRYCLLLLLSVSVLGPLHL